MSKRDIHYCYILEIPNEVPRTSGWVVSIDTLINRLSQLYALLPKEVLNFKTGDIGVGTILTITRVGHKKGESTISIRDARLNSVENKLRKLEEEDK